MSFKALADPARLRIVRILARQETTVKALAQSLSLTEPTVSHHLSKLRAVGFVALRAEGGQHHYRLNEDAIARFKAQVAELESADSPTLDSANNDWIAALDIADEAKAVLRAYTFAGRLRQYPSKEVKLLIVLDWIASHFQLGTIYTEPEVNATIQRFHDDFATLRRDLIDYGYLRRERGGQTYWLARVGEPRPEPPL
ncbi:MAG: metalloregulator ArsR/SmtB family transcription factor [Chloroflexota bacterium]|nr:metalloregulator ArsR/SmtB family transcription factor [Chloroflexota bacterium]